MPAVRETSTSRKMNTYTVCVPQGAESSFLRTMSRNMGWTITPQPRKRKAETRYPALDRAIEDVKKGNVYYAKDLDDLFAQLEI